MSTKGPAPELDRHGGYALFFFKEASLRCGGSVPTWLTMALWQQGRVLGSADALGSMTDICGDLLSTWIICALQEVHD